MYQYFVGLSGKTSLRDSVDVVLDRIDRGRIDMHWENPFTRATEVVFSQCVDVEFQVRECIASGYFGDQR